MAIKAKVSLAFFLFFLLSLLCSNLVISKEERDPEIKTCKHQCRQQLQYSEEDKNVCMEECDEYHRMKKEREKRKEQDQDEDENENPYVFKSKDFDTRIDTEDGRVLVLNKFNDKSKLLRNIENYGLAVLEVKGHAFVSPHHFDSEVIIFNVKGNIFL